ncbi:MAG: helix-turn-helix domain-containing protein [Erythrobacter sp.]|uniref:TetR/AcrR family transcriptional regulator n=1 Tax=Erythrobacter sp. TaxID=1042 RepID=UPI0032988EE2
MSSKREQSIAERKARILEAARTIIARDGYDALTTRGIAEAAGVTAPTLYNLVGDKTAIISAMATASVEELWGRLHLDERGSPLAMADAILNEAYAQIMANRELNRANLIALERLGIAYAYHPARDDPGAHAARRSVEMVQYTCREAQRLGQLRGNLDAQLLAEQMFAAYRAPLDDWLHDAIGASEMLRRQRIGFYTVLAADASEEFREELLARIAKLAASQTVHPKMEKEAA